MAEYSIFPDNLSGVANDSDTSALTLGTEFYVAGTETCWLTAIRYWNGSGPNEASNRQVALYEVIDGSSGTLVYGPVTVSQGVQESWVVHTLETPLELSPENVNYRVVVYHPAGRYAAEAYYFGWFFDYAGPGADGIYSGPIAAPKAADAVNNAQGSYVEGGALAYPTSAYQATSYFVDVVVSDIYPGSGDTLNNLRLGATTPTALYYGDTQVDRVYHGADLVMGEEPE